MVHRLLEASPLVAVSVHASVEERPSASYALSERIRQLSQHGFDFHTMFLEAARVEPDGHHDSFRPHMVGSVFPPLEEAVEEDFLHSTGVEHERVAHDRSFPSVSRYLNVENEVIL